MFENIHRAGAASAGRMVAGALLGGAALLCSGVASAQQAPLTEATVAEIVRALMPRGEERKFRPVRPPDANTSLCSADDVRGAAAGGRPSGTPSNKTLEPVPYQPDVPRFVDLAVHFATGSDELTAREKALIDNVAQAMNEPQLRPLRFAIAGHTDATGDQKVNLRLSCARALTVMEQLTRRGVDPARLSAYGFGSQRPLEGTQRESQMNRRVEVRTAL